MRTMRWFGLLLALSVIAVPAWATNEEDGKRIGNQASGGGPTGIIVGGWNAADTTYHVIPVTGTGTSAGLSVIDPERDRDANVLFQSVINVTALAYNAGDSSGVLNTHDLAHSVLYIKAVPSGGGVGDTINVVRLAFQVRGHLNGLSDSTSVFPFYPSGQVASLGVSATAPDTLNQGHIFRGGRNAAWSGEFIITIALNRKAQGAGIAINGRDWYFPNGLAIPLDNLFGRNFWSPYTSIRVRNIGPGTATCDVTCHLVGTPL